MMYRESAESILILARRTLAFGLGAAVALAPAACGRDWNQMEVQEEATGGGGGATSTSSVSSGSAAGGAGGGEAARCAPGQTSCDALCVVLDTDPNHCGTCENACAPGAACVQGACQCFAGVVEQINPMLPQDIHQSTVGTPDIYTTTCGGVGAGERIYQLTAPVDGSYSFEILQPNYAPVLAVLSGATCEELACDEKSSDAGAMWGARASVDLRAGESVYVVVSGVDGAQGSFDLSVGQRRLSDCTPIPLEGGEFPLTVQGNTTFLGDSGTPTCRPRDTPGPDAVYLFEAPADGTYLFDTNGSRFETVLEVLEGDCNGDSFGCARSAGGVQPSIRIPMLAGQVVVLRVDGFGGASGGYTLNVDVAPPPVCANIPLAGPLPLVVAGDTTGRIDSLTPSCAPPGGADIDYLYAVPADGTYNIVVDAPRYDTVLSVRDATCDAEEIDCNDDNPDVNRSALTMNLTAGQIINIAVDSYYGGAQGPFTLTISH